MTLEGLRGYLLLASGLTEVTRRRASTVARSILASGGQAAGGLVPDPVKVTVAAVTDELVATGRANRELMIGLVRGEIDRAVTRLGLVDASELEAVTQELTRVQTRLARLEAEASSGGTTPRAATRRPATARATAARRTSAPAKRAKPATRAGAKPEADAGAGTTEADVGQAPADAGRTETDAGTSS
jgi:hypothetical protein